MRPPWLKAGLASPADMAACRALLRGGSRSFFAASFALPLPVRDAATGLYAFCRQADDEVDLDAGPDSSRRLTLARLHRRLALIYAGRPEPLAADRAFSDVVTRFAIPRALPEALLEGLSWDAAGRDYRDLSQLYDYAARVAGTVGVMMTLLMGIRQPQTLARACELGVAMQLTNIARDVGEDARAGRLYLPVDWLREVGIDPTAWLVRPVFSPALGRVIRRLLRAAELLYLRADAGIAQLPPGCRPGVRAARLLYAEIGREVERQGYDSVSTRAVVSAQRKAAVLTRAVAGFGRRDNDDLPPLEETRFLIDAVEPACAAAPRWGLSERVVWVLELFARLGASQTIDSGRPVGYRNPSLVRDGAD